MESNTYNTIECLANWNLIQKGKKDRALFVQFEWNEWIGKSARILLGTVQYQHCQHTKKKPHYTHIFRIHKTSWKWMILMVVCDLSEKWSFFWYLFLLWCCWSGGKMINFYTKNGIMFKATIHENVLCVCVVCADEQWNRRTKWNEKLKKKHIYSTRNMHETFSCTSKNKQRTRARERE